MGKKTSSKCMEVINHKSRTLTARPLFRTCQTSHPGGESARAFSGPGPGPGTGPGAQPREPGRGGGNWLESSSPRYLWLGHSSQLAHLAPNGPIRALAPGLSKKASRFPSLP